MTAAAKLCACGCGETPARGDFLPGHDSQAVWRVIREQYGSTLDFLAEHDNRCDTCHVVVDVDAGGWWVGPDKTSDCPGSPQGHTVKGRTRLL